VAVVGESNYQATIREEAGVRRGEAVSCVVEAELLAEPDNAYDANAIAVFLSGAKAGYLSRGDALDFAPVMTSLAAAGYGSARCAAVISGRGRDGDTSNLGVFLHVGRPDDLVEVLRSPNE
jgi:hypothetical protein